MDPHLAGTIDLTRSLGWLVEKSKELMLYLALLAFSALSLAHRAFAAQAIFAGTAADIVPLLFGVLSASLRDVVVAGAVLS